MSEMTIEFDLGDDYPELREGVAKVCKNYPPSYWEHLENQPPSGSYPTEFVNALTTNLTSFFREKHHFEFLKTYD